MNDNTTAANHRHCGVCEKPTSLNEQFCSQECRVKAVRQRRSQRASTWILLGVVIFLLVIFFLVSGI
ncbi:DUF2116 family Zn-ribbon domain-containing protein [Chloroflexota bacterium]